MQLVACVPRRGVDGAVVSRLCPEERGAQWCCSQWLVSRGEGCTVVPQSVVCVSRRGVHGAAVSAVLSTFVVQMQVCAEQVNHTQGDIEA